MRIFLHPSAEVDLRATRTTEVRLLPLPEPFKNASAEVDYLHEQRATGSAEFMDRDLFDAVIGMEEEAAADGPSTPSEISEVRLQYSETKAALNRMRRANSRQPFGV